MMKVILPLIFTLFAISNAFTQTSFPAKKQYSKIYNSELSTKFKNWSIFEMNTDELERIVRSEEGDVEIHLSFGNEFTWKLDLHNSNLYSDHFLSRTEKETLSSENRPIAMKGYRIGGINDRVALTISENFIYGFVENNKKIYYIEPLNYLVSDANSSLFIIYEQEDVIKDATVKCGATERKGKGEKLIKHEGHSHENVIAEKSMLVCKLVEIAIASDFSMFQKYGTVAGVEAHNVGVMNNVGMDYDDSFADEIQFEIVEQFTVSTNGGDPWTANTDPGVLLDDFTAWGPGGFSNAHDIGQHWSDRDFDGSTIGLAWVGVVCTNNRYHVLQDYTNSAWGLRVLTSHEMGHNFSLGHDSEDDPFIMAPAVNNTIQWSPNSITTMNNYIPGLNCLGLCPPPVPPVAAFTANFTEICTGSSVAFSDESTNQPNTWVWSFPGGNPTSSTDQFPIVSYPNAGTYNVTLTASNNVGSDNQTSSGYITVGAGGTDFFYAENFSGDISDWTIENPDNGVTWTQTAVIEGNHGTQAMFMDNYDYNANGQLDGLISPTIDFSGRNDAILEIEYAYTNYDAQFNDSLIVSISSNDGATYSRVFQEGENGGGTLATRPTTTDEFAPGSATDWCFAGTYGSACLSIDLSAYNSATTKLKIENRTGFGNNMYVQYVSLTSSCQSFSAPVATFSASQTEGCSPLTVQYSDNSIGSPESWNWTFPGGTPTSSTQQNPTVVYNTPGSYNATLVASNGIGSDSQSQNNIITVLEDAIADFNVSGSGATWNFTDLSTNANSYSWDFGDTNNSNQQNPTHTYAFEGEFVVTLTVTNECGTQTSTETVVVENMPTALFFAQETGGCAPLTVEFTNQSLGLNATPSWSFPGGTPATSTEMNPTVVYNTIGVYTVTLTMTNSAGEDTEVQTNYIVVNDVPAPNFSLIANELSVDFTNNTTNAVSYSWDFGDNTNSTDLNPSHTYGADGIYLVVLTATNDCGSITYETEVEVALMPVAPTAGFTATNTEGCEPFTVEFTNLSSANAETFLWTFEGGTPATSTDLNPTVVFNNAGTFSASLIATNGVGDDTSMQTDYIVVNPLPVADFSSMTTDLTVSLNNTSDEAVSYSWNFGDTNTSELENPMHTYAEDGTYTITLIASNSCGEITTNQEVIVATEPIAAFSANTTEGCEPFTVQYTNMSSPNADAFMWTFEGGNPATSTDENPTVVYSTPGLYGATLMVINEVGSNESIVMDYITVNALPAASFGSSGNELDVTFSNTSQAGATYSWDFGDTNTSTLENPTNSYAEEGTYLVILTVTNGCGLDVFTQEVEVSLTPTVPTAAFSANTTEGCEPFTVQYTNLSSANATTYAWTFEGGTPATSTDANPTVTYSTPGIYPVSLTSSNEVGDGIANEVNYITVNPLPAANFTPVANELSIDFTNTSQDGTSYSWNFGDTNTSVLENPTNVYAVEGIYTVTLTVTNECGTDVITQEVNASLTPVAPTAAFSANTTEGCEPFIVQYTNLSSANAATYEWTFEGGTPATSTDANPTVTYSTPGIYAVSLISSNEVGDGIANEVNYITVNPLPAANFTPVANELSIDFTNTSQDGTSYSWNFGDTNTSVLENPTNVYAVEGIYIVTLTVTNECGTDVITQEVNASLAPVAPTAAFSATETSGCAPFTVQYTNLSSANTENITWTFEGGVPAISTDANPTVVYMNEGLFDVTLTATNIAGEDIEIGTNYMSISAAPTGIFNQNVTNLVVDFINSTNNVNSYSWDFGDAQTSIEENPTHIYAADGTYLVTLVVTNECGVTTISEEITVSAAPIAPVAGFMAETTEGCEPMEIQMINQSTSNVETYLWEVIGATPSISTEENPVFLFNQAGVYSVSLTVGNEVGEDTQTEMNYIIVNPLPQASFNSNTNLNTVTFTSNSQDGTTYLWDFGDTQTSIEENPTHVYATEGSYIVTLTVTNDCGTSIWTQNLLLGAMMPSSAFSADITEGCTPLIVQFMDNSTNEPTEWNWTFVGGTPSTSDLKNPVVTFENPGDFDVTLQAINDIGSNTLLQNMYINTLDIPVPNFEWNNNNLSVSFINTSEYGTEYLWNFGDGNSSNVASPTHEFDEEIEYIITLTVTNECGEMTYTEVINLKPNGLDELDFINEFNVYPNPNNGVFVIDIAGENIGNVPLEIRLINIVGQVLNKEDINFNGSLQKVYHYSNLAAGMYFVELRMEGESLVRKVVVE